ncbi:hypothetical protein GCM10010841_22340 [Deinococcus aerophilus]|uniref:Uncharacterized protein n=1 Tax=Deinococcus aerophilus TaxID=522488 RepID=A0ABQ2GTX9_9DEIO|nr:hypothetical protein GCM10010841_22340 [Deinococcus aerophilus]
MQAVMLCPLSEADPPEPNIASCKQAVAVSRTGNVPLNQYLSRGKAAAPQVDRQPLKWEQGDRSVPLLFLRFVVANLTSFSIS